MKTYNQYPPYQRTREMSIEDMLLENRIIFIPGPITDGMAGVVIMRLLYLQSIKKDQDVHLYINSPGGLVTQTLAIYYTIQYMGCDVATYCVGAASSGGAIILSAGTKGKRYALPHAKVMIHQPWGMVYGQTSDMRIQADEILKVKRTLLEIMAKHTGKDVAQLEKDTERDRFMDAMVAWGDATAIRQRIQAHFDAGANHVCIQPLHPNGERLPDLEAMEALAP